MMLGLHCSPGRSALGIARLLATLLLCSVAAGPAMAWTPCERDLDCKKGYICPRTGTYAGHCMLDAKTPYVLGGDIAMPRPDRDPTSKPPRTPSNPFTSFQCGTDRDCPDGYGCRRHNTDDKWYCRKR